MKRSRCVPPSRGAASGRGAAEVKHAAFVTVVSTRKVGSTRWPLLYAAMIMCGGTRLRLGCGATAARASGVDRDGSGWRLLQASAADRPHSRQWHRCVPRPLSCHDEGRRENPWPLAEMGGEMVAESGPPAAKCLLFLGVSGPVPLATSLSLDAGHLAR